MNSERDRFEIRVIAPKARVITRAAPKRLNKDCSVLIRTTEDEREAWKRASKREGLTVSEWLRDAAAKVLAPPVEDRQRQAATPAAHAGGNGKSLLGGFDPGLLNKLGVKTLAQVEAGEVAKPIIHGNTFTRVEGASIDVGDAPVEDVATKPWLPILKSIYHKQEIEGDWEIVPATLGAYKLPSKWISWSMVQRASWLDANHPLEV